MKSVVCWLWNDSPQPTSSPPAPPKPKLSSYSSPPFALLESRQSRHRARRRTTGGTIPRVKPVKPRIFLPGHVNTLARACARHLSGHRFVCVADKSDGLEPHVEWLKTPDAAAALSELRSPEGERFPSCYRRLWVFSEEARVLGDHILTTDIDAVVLRDLAPLFDTPGDFVGWRPYRDWGRRLRFGGGTYLLRTGTRTEVWTRFRGQESIVEARAAGFRGSDQAWLSYLLAEKEPYFGKDAGIYSVRDLGPGLNLPSDARIVHFNGHTKPWHYHADLRLLGGQWVRAHWR